MLHFVFFDLIMLMNSFIHLVSILWWPWYNSPIFMPPYSTTKWGCWTQNASFVKGHSCLIVSYACSQIRLEWCCSNCMPTDQSHAIHYSRWSNPLYCAFSYCTYLPPKIFGCVYPIHSLSPGSDKLDPRSIKCVFLRYSRTQKGYWCYSPTLRCRFTSADVTFDES